MSDCKCQQQAANPFVSHIPAPAAPGLAVNPGATHVRIPPNIHVLQLSGGISANYNAQTNQICFDLPIVGAQCIQSPVSLPVGATLSASFQSCNVWGVPVGVQVAISFNNNVIWNGSFGHC